MTEQRNKDVSVIQKRKEILFMGKSNSGKSSLLNEILGTKVCNVSKNPVDFNCREVQNISINMTWEKGYLL